MANPRGHKSPQAKWCLLRDNSTVRLAVAHKKKVGNYKLTDLEAMTGIQAYRISRYLLGRKPNLNQFQLYSLCKKLGIEVTVKVEFLK